MWPRVMLGRWRRRVRLGMAKWRRKLVALVMDPRFERLVLYATAMGNIRDVIPFPRTVGQMLH